MLELSDSIFRKFLREAPNSFIIFLCECLLNVINGNVPVNKQLLKNQEDSFQQLLSKETSLKKKQFILTKKSQLVKAIAFSCYLYLKVNNACRRICLIPKRMFISKNPTKEEIFDNPIYQQKATQLSLLQRSNPKFEQSTGKKDADTSTDRRIARTRRIDDGISDPDDAKSELFVSDDSEIEPVVKKRKDSAFDSIMLELKLMDENKTKRAAIILKKFLILILFLLVKRIMFSILKMNLKE